MIDKPFFSVIIPTFNRVGVLRRAIDSALIQSFKDFELLIVDDGSTDNTRETVYSISDSRVSYKHQTNKGVCAARNKGASISKAKYLVFLDSDDELYPNALQIIYDSAAKNEFPDLVFSDLEKKKWDGSIVYTSARNPYGNGVGKEIGIFMVQAYSIRKEFFNQLGGFDENINFGENAELKIRIEKKAFTYSLTEHPVCIYNESVNGGAKHLANRVKSNQYTINKHPDFFSKNKQVLKLFLQSNAVAQVRLRKMKDARISIRRAFIVTPFDFSLILRLIIIHLPFIPKIVWK